MYRHVHKKICQKCCHKDVNTKLIKGQLICGTKSRALKENNKTDRIKILSKFIADRIRLTAKTTMLLGDGYCKCSRNSFLTSLDGKLDVQFYIYTKTCSTVKIVPVFVE